MERIRESFCAWKRERTSVNGLDAQLGRRSQNLLELMGDDGTGLLGHLILRGKIKVIGAVVKSLERRLVSCEHTGANMDEII